LSLQPEIRTFTPSEARGQDGIWRGTWIKIWPVTATDTQPDALLCLYRLTPLRAQQAATVSNREQTNQLI
jgi:hypothetical protein